MSHAGVEGITTVGCLRFVFLEEPDHLYGQNQAHGLGAIGTGLVAVNRSLGECDGAT